MSKEVKKARKAWSLESLDSPKLVFSAYAWNKLNFMKNRAKTEVSGFGISSDEDPFYVEDFVLIKQVSSCATTDMDEEAIADHMEDMMDRGKQPHQSMRIWIHTHPGFGPNPSSTDRMTFKKVFGSCDWAIMYILGENDSTCHLRISKPSMIFKISSGVDYCSGFEEWEKELEQKVSRAVIQIPKQTDVSKYLGKVDKPIKQTAEDFFELYDSDYNYGCGIEEDEFEFYQKYANQ